ncbi:hypothetical protein PCANC_06910 [Puccinia coronata f. sp. avenae]|uniref:Uncharacterized protein n=1 Tax=Puccinia coronata f. sp. avenae TaxID=200324 RepID=A0A2N5VGY5_9BASI|nr:hypothetical protein PCANC_06910 [Puccinia coronata f. sp. avenae]
MHPESTRKPTAVIKKVLSTCISLNELPTKLSPKDFFLNYLESTNQDIVYLRRLWAVPAGIPSLMGVARALSKDMRRTPEAKEAWAAFIRNEALDLLLSETPPRGNYPPCVSQTEAVAKPKDIIITIGPKEVAGIGYTTPGTSQEGGNERAHRMATTICPMVAFGKNQRNNYLQLHNTVRLFACGASERVHEYMNYIGLSSLHSTALSALKTLAVESAETLKSLMKVKNNPLIAPSICINNIDIEQHVHQVSVGNLSNIVRGTWGYIHVPNQRLLKTLNASEISLGAYQRSLESIKGMGINPSMFLPTIQEEQSEINVISLRSPGYSAPLRIPKGKVSALSHQTL